MSSDTENTEDTGPVKGFTYYAERAEGALEAADNCNADADHWIGIASVYARLAAAAPRDVEPDTRKHRVTMRSKGAKLPFPRTARHYTCTEADCDWAVLVDTSLNDAEAIVNMPATHPKRNR